MAKKKQVKLNVPRSIRRLFPNTEYAIDADKPIEVAVRKSDCDKATPLDPTECALARAAKREYHADAAIIGISTSYIIKDNKAIRFKTPESVRREIVNFDRHSEFEPGEYYLTPHSPSLKLGISHPSEKKKKKQLTTVQNARFIKQLRLELFDRS